MQSLNRLLVIISFFVLMPTAFAGSGCCSSCCNGMGGIQYCDSSAGRYVCMNGYYSSCYCTRHAVMDLQKFEGCCLWQGGVLTVDDKTGLVICNNGGVSAVCSVQSPRQSVAAW